MSSLKLILSKSRYFSVAWVFCSLNIMIGTWVLYIPYVKENLNLTDSQIGFALFYLALGILLFAPLVPFITKKIGLGNYTILGVTLFSISFIGPLMASNYVLLCTSLFIVGIFSGTTDVAMNALVSQIEKQDDINFMSSAHGFFSLGGALGAILGTFFMFVFFEPVYHIMFIALCVIILNVWLSKHYRKIKEMEASENRGRFQIKQLRPLWIIAFLAFVIMSSEGAIEHWSSLFLLEVLEIAQNNLAGLGFILFSITMTIGRFFGDGITARIGSMKTILIGCLVASVGYVCILTAVMIITVTGFGIVGLGLSVIVPELFRIAGKTKGVKGSTGIAFVSSIGFVGFLLGPVMLGFISDKFSLKISFFTLLLLVIIAMTSSFIRFKIFKMK